MCCISATTGIPRSCKNDSNWSILCIDSLYDSNHPDEKRRTKADAGVLQLLRSVGKKLGWLYWASTFYTFYFLCMCVTECDTYILNKASKFKPFLHWWKYQNVQ